MYRKDVSSANCFVTSDAYSQDQGCSGIYTGSTDILNVLYLLLLFFVVPLMIGLHSSLLVICATWIVVSKADLISDFSQQSFKVLSSGQNGYADASTACKLFDLFFCAIMISFFFS